MSKYKPNTLQYICEQKGIKWSTFVNRFYHLGWELDRALNEKPNTRKENAHKRWAEMLELYQSGKSKKEIAEKFDVDLWYVTRAIRLRRRELQQGV